MSDWTDVKDWAATAAAGAYDYGIGQRVLALIAESEQLRDSSNMRAIRSLRGDCADLVAERDQLKAENEALRKALKTIREESHDIGACECAADALADAAMGQGSCPYVTGGKP